MPGEQLTSLATVKSWLNVPTSNTDADPLLTRLIKSASGFVTNYLNRDALALTEFSEVYDGRGSLFMLLRKSPVWLVEAVSFFGTPVSAAIGDGFTSPRASGWALEPEYSPQGSQRLNFYGVSLPRGRASVAVRYKAGYVNVETMKVPSTPFQVTTAFRYLGLVSAMYGDVPLVQVDASPITGQFSATADGTFLFAAADVGKPFTITYSYVPSDIEQAVIEMVAERYKARDRIGINSKSLGGQETISFSNATMSNFARELLAPYRDYVPV